MNIDKIIRRTFYEACEKLRAEEKEAQRKKLEDAQKICKQMDANLKEARKICHLVAPQL